MLIQILFKNSALASEKTQHISIAKISWLTLFREVIGIYSENHMKCINTVDRQSAELLIVK
jgi:hypothetical protein